MVLLAKNPFQAFHKKFVEKHQKHSFDMLGISGIVKLTKKYKIKWMVFLSSMEINFVFTSQ